MGGGGAWGKQVRVRGREEERERESEKARYRERERERHWVIMMCHHTASICAGELAVCRAYCCVTCRAVSQNVCERESGPAGRRILWPYLARCLRGPSRVCAELFIRSLANYVISGAVNATADCRSDGDAQQHVHGAALYCAAGLWRLQHWNLLRVFNFYFFLFYFFFTLLGFSLFFNGRGGGVSN